MPYPREAAARSITWLWPRSQKNRSKDWTMEIKGGDIKNGDIKQAVRQFIAENVLLGLHQTTIDDATPLVTGGLIDSIGMIGLVAFLENRFAVEFMPREIDVHSLDNLDRIEELIRKKLAGPEAGFATGSRCRRRHVSAQTGRRLGRDYEPQSVRWHPRIISLSVIFPGGLRKFALDTSSRFDHGDERDTAKRDGRHGVRCAAGRDGDDWWIADERRGGHIHGSGSDGSERHLRGWSEYGNDERERRGHLVGVHSEWESRSLYGVGCSNRSVDAGQLQSDEHSGGGGSGQRYERKRAKRGDQHGVYKSAGGDGGGQWRQPGTGSRRVGDVHGSGNGSERHLRVELNGHGNRYDQRERRGYLVCVHSECDGRRTL